jgi:NitT/TauT family transport system substrate-binding protein
VIGKGKWGYAATAVALTAVTALAAGCSSSGGSGVDSVAGNLPTNYGPAEQTTLNVGVVPAMDSAGFFVAQSEGLFAKEGLKIHYSAATSSETAIDQQVKNQLQITAGNYVSYIHYEADPAHASTPLEVISEGSVMQQGAQVIFTMPSSHINTLSQLKGKLVGVNAPDNIDYLLGVSVLKENGIDSSLVKFPNGKDRASAQYNDDGAIPFPDMAGDLASGEVAAAIMPEPFASLAEQQYGAVPLADLNQGATTDFPIEGYVVTKAWAEQNPNTLKRFLAALSAGQEIADTDRSAVEKAFESLNGPQNGSVPNTIAAVMSLDTYPIGIDQTRLQRVANVMYQFNLLPSAYNVKNMLMPSSEFDFSPFSAAGS